MQFSTKWFFYRLSKRGYTIDNKMSKNDYIKPPVSMPAM